MTAVSAMSVSAFAESSLDNETVTSDNMKTEYTEYDSDLVYIPEHAAIIAEYNEKIKKTRRASYSAWSWNNGVYSFVMDRSSTMVIPYYFIPVANYLYFNVEIAGCTSEPYLTVNKYNVDGTLVYQGSYNIDSTGNNAYAWDNKKRPLTAGEKYVFSLLTDDHWSSAIIDIYKSSF